MQMQLPLFPPTTRLINSSVGVFEHVSRQKLCLPGMQEFWVNSKSGMPYSYVNEKLQSAILNEIIPRLIEDIPCKYSVEELAADNELPRFTLVFDREAYSPALFEQLWNDYRVAVITYRKNVTDLWADGDFKPTKIII